MNPSPVRPHVKTYVAVASCSEERCSFEKRFGEEVSWWDREGRARRSAAGHEANTSHPRDVWFETVDGDPLPYNPLDEFLLLDPGE